MQTAEEVRRDVMEEQFGLNEKNLNREWYLMHSYLTKGNLEDLKEQSVEATPISYYPDFSRPEAVSVEQLISNDERLKIKLIERVRNEIKMLRDEQHSLRRLRYTGPLRSITNIINYSNIPKSKGFKIFQKAYDGFYEKFIKPNYKNRNWLIKGIKRIGKEMHLLSNFLEAEEQLKMKIRDEADTTAGIEYKISMKMIRIYAEAVPAVLTSGL
ncbi:hypothetical protein KY332_01855 [Candidatus Woesearchaeota archaeon]|nr:hypothetical protein [Candidatus Woesearchaeota archaeon]